MKTLVILCCLVMGIQSAYSSVVCQTDTSAGTSGMEYNAVLNKFLYENVHWVKEIESASVGASFIKSITVDHNKTASVTYYSALARKTFLARYKISWTTSERCNYPVINQIR